MSIGARLVSTEKGGWKGFNEENTGGETTERGQGATVEADFKFTGLVGAVKKQFEEVIASGSREAIRVTVSALKGKDFVRMIEQLRKKYSTQVDQIGLDIGTESFCTEPTAINTLKEVKLKIDMEDMQPYNRVIEAPNLIALWEKDIFPRFIRIKRSVLDFIRLYNQKKEDKNTYGYIATDNTKSSLAALYDVTKHRKTQIMPIDG